MADSIYEKIKQVVDIADVVQRHGVSLDRHGKAICPFHNEKTPSFFIQRNENKFHCFGCGAGGDAVDFVERIKGVTNYEAAKVLAEMYGINDNESGYVKTSPPPKITKSVQNINPALKQGITDYINSSIADTGKTDYFIKRGLSKDTIERFKLGYDAKESRVVIPYSDELAYYQTRSIEGRRFLKPPSSQAGAEPLFNPKALETIDPVFVVESPICAMSIEQCGGKAVSICGATGGQKLITELQREKPSCTLILSLDNDKPGREAQESLATRLANMDIRFIQFNIAGDCKDPNELLIKDPKALTSNINSAQDASSKAMRKKAENKDEQVKALLNKEITDPKDVFAEEYIDAIPYAKINLASDYALFRMRAKEAKVPLRDLDNAVTQHQKSYKAKVETETPLNLGRDLSGALAPKGWNISLEDGVRKIINTRDGEHEIIACPDAVIITARLINAEDSKERLELSFYKDGSWKKVIGARTQVYNKNSIIVFGDDGLHITSETAKDLVGYLSDYEIVNKKAIPLKKSIARVGWIGVAEFFPFSTDEEIVFEDGGGTYVFHNLREQGDYVVWKESMARLRKNPFARFVTSASFASPLLIKMGVRPFAIHIWHNSASGKSALLKAAMSVWGDPERIMVTGFATIVGLEQKAGMLNHLPLGIDEKQAADENKMPFPRLIYMLGEGEGKTRGARGGGNQETVTWHNIAIITGEEPITSASTKDGVQTRTLELNGKPVDDTDFAQEVHRTSEKNFGYAGPAFIRAVCQRLKAEPDFLTKRYSENREALRAKGLKGVHTEYIAAITAADVLVETIIFGTDLQTAEKESFENGIFIFKHNEEQLHGDNIESAYAFALGWIASNQARFKDDTDLVPRFGRKSDQGKGIMRYDVVPQHLEDALINAGFNVEKVTRGFADKKYIQVYTDANDKRRKKHQVLFNGVRMDMYRFEININDPIPIQMNLKDLTPVEIEGELPF